MNFARVSNGISELLCDVPLKKRRNIKREHQTRLFYPRTGPTLAFWNINEDAVTVESWNKHGG